MENEAQQGLTRWLDCWTLLSVFGQLAGLGWILTGTCVLSGIPHTDVGGTHLYEGNSLLTPFQPA